MWFKTNPLDVVDAPADMYHYGVNDALTPLYIIIHATAGRNSLKWLTTQSNPPVSVHRLIARDGTIYKIVDDSRVAWHTGHAIWFPNRLRILTNLNNLALGVELENLNDGKQDYTAQQMDALTRQVCEWFGKYGYLPILSHAAVDSRKSDPAGFNWTSFMGMVARSITSSIG